MPAGVSAGSAVRRSKAAGAVDQILGQRHRQFFRPGGAGPHDQRLGEHARRAGGAYLLRPAQESDGAPFCRVCDVIQFLVALPIGLGPVVPEGRPKRLPGLVLPSRLTDEMQRVGMRTGLGRICNSDFTDGANRKLFDSSY